MATLFSVSSESHPAPAGSAERRWDGRLFGVFRLIAPDGTDATPTSRKACALVAYLLTAGDDGTTRERLAGLLWSERGDDQARASLRQTFYELRALTSGDAPPIAIERTRVALVAARVTTDVARLDEAARADDATALAALVGPLPAEFLADLDGIDPAFDEWLSGERTRRRDARRRVLLAAADRKLAANDEDAALHLSDRLLACDPADEAAARIAMQASHRRGDRDAVRRRFASVTDALRRLVGVPPSAETEHVYRRSMAAPRSPVEPLVVSPQGGDERAASRMQEDAGESAAVPEFVPAVMVPEELADAPDTAANAPSSQRALRWTLLAAAVALLAVGVVEVVGWRHAGASAMRRVLLVEPIQLAAGDADAAVLRTGFTSELARVLVGKPAFVVRDADPPTDRSADYTPDQTFVVAAESQSHNGVLHVGLRLLARKDGPILWATTLVGPAGEVDALREQMAVKVADVAVCALDGRYTDLRDFRPATLQLLLRACDLRHTESLEAVKVLRQLTQDVPGFGHGWAMLAATTAGGDESTTTDRNGAATRIESYARRAIERDPHDGTAYLARAFDLPGVARWPQRMTILRDGLAVDPDNADLQDALAHQYALLGYWQQAIAWSDRAVQNDPFSPPKAAFHARLLGMAVGYAGPTATGEFAEARRRFGADPELLLAEYRFQALLGDHRRAAQLLLDPSQGMHFQPARAAMWSAILTMRAEPTAAHEAEAERAFVAAIRAIPDINPWTFETLSFLHRVDEAYAYADRMPPRPSWENATDALFDLVTRPLRADPRFMTLAERFGFVTVWRATDQWPDFCSEPDLGYDCRVEAARAQSPDRRPLVPVGEDRSTPVPAR